MHLLISIVLCLAIVSVSTENSNEEATCDALDQLAQNVNRDFLHQCSVDGENCVFVRCRARGIFANFFRSVAFSVQPCAGLEVDLIEANGMTAFKEIVITPTIITRSFNTSIVSINLQVNMTSTSLTVSVDPVTINSQPSGALVGFTPIPIDQSGCRNQPSPGIIVTSPTPRRPSSTVAATVATTTVQPQIVVPNIETCAGFDRLARNVNPQLLSNCGQNSACTQITCQAMGQLSIEVDAVSIMLDVCKNNTAPGVIFELLRDERAVFNQRITSSTKINYSKVGTATIEATIFLNSTNSSIGISVDPVTVSEQSFISGSNSLSATLLNFTQVPFNVSYCYIGLQDSHSTGAPVVATFELILLALALTVALSLVHLNVFDILCLFI